MQKRFHLACLGRLAVDFYGVQRMTSLEESSSFRRYLGGSSGNLAVGAARMGLQVAMLSAVGNDPMGRFLLQQLDREGIDRCGVRTVPDRKTALAFLGMQGAEAVGLDFYRQAPADEAVTLAPEVQSVLVTTDVLAVTGTHFVTPDAAANDIVEAGVAAGCRVVLDIDYRAALWQAADGGPTAAAARVAKVAAQAGLVVGNIEEFEALTGAKGLMPSLNAARGFTKAELVVKLGPEGAAHIAGEIPASSVDLDVVGGPVVEVENPVGAGDAFLSAFLSGWMTGAPMQECLGRGAASGALVVTRHACSDAMPFAPELDEFRAGDADHTHHIHRVLSRVARPARVLALACDHRDPIRDLLAEHNRPYADGETFKQLVARAAERVFAKHGHATGAMLMDPQFGAQVLDEKGQSGWWLGRPIEVTGTRPLQAEAGVDMAADLMTWNPRQVAKVLVWHHPDDPADLQRDQIRTLLTLQANCHAAGIEWMLEVVPPLDMGHDDEVLRRGVDQMYGAGLKPDYLKLPVLETQTGWDRMADLVRTRDPFCRGIVVLGLNQPFDVLSVGLELASRQEICAGFAVGRTVFGAASRQWLAGDIDDETAVTNMAAAFDRIVQIFLESQASSGQGIAEEAQSA